jgi:hypothetical protein
MINRCITVITIPIPKFTSVNYIIIYLIESYDKKKM